MFSVVFWPRILNLFSLLHRSSILPFLFHLFPFSAFPFIPFFSFHSPLFSPYPAFSFVPPLPFLVLSLSSPPFHFLPSFLPPLSYIFSPPSPSYPSPFLLFYSLPFPLLIFLLPSPLLPSSSLSSLSLTFPGFPLFPVPSRKFKISDMWPFCRFCSDYREDRYLGF